LRLWASGATTPGSIDVYTLQDAWDERAITPASAPTGGTKIATFSVPAGGGWIVVDITSAVRSWREFPLSDHGIMLAASGATPGVSVQFDSKENTLTSHAAAVDIHFNGPAGPPGPAGPMGGVGPVGPTGPTGKDGAGLTLIWRGGNVAVEPGIPSLIQGSCPVPEKIVSGGCIATDDLHGDINLFHSAKRGEGWECGLYNLGASTKTVQMSYLCGK
jgi:hypothetical protein